MVIYLIAIRAIKLFSSLAQFIKTMDTFHVSFHVKYKTYKSKIYFKGSLRILIKYLTITIIWQLL